METYKKPKEIKNEIYIQPLVTKEMCPVCKDQYANHEPGSKWCKNG